ncbi:MAG: Crp/Fnr family transcriptional regulator [Actinomycetota bacterium]|nr:Crp/Fnr family transcriptional regulator [Actinomycetota bacterium]
MALTDQIDETCLDRLASLGERRSHGNGEVLHREGAEPDALVVLHSGHVKLSVTGHGDRPVLIDLRGPGHALGALAVVDGLPHGETATGVGEVRTVVVGRAELLERAETDAALANDLLRLVVREARTRERPAEQTARDTDALARLCGRLAQLGDAAADLTPAEAATFAWPLSDQELADWSGLPVDGVQRGLTILADLGWVRPGAGGTGLIVLDPTALRSRAA